MSHNNHRYILIIAGGAGTRLWPLSRSDSPKQFQKLAGEQTLIQHMASLAERVVPADHICVMTIDQFSETVHEQLPQIPVENIFTEPARRNNGPAIALAMLHMEKRDPEAVVAFIWSDHLIQNAEVFGNTLTAALTAAEHYENHTVLCGAKPTYPETGLGYIQMGKEVAQFENVPVFEAKRFVEKPDHATAVQFVRSWEYLWNMGYHAVQVKTFMRHLLEANPDLDAQISALRQAVKTGDKTALAEHYQEFPAISIDYLYTQKQKDILVVPADMGWSDVGNWNTLHDVMKYDEVNLVTRGPVQSVNTNDCLIIAKDRLIATVGLENIIIVDTGDTILIMNKNAAQEMRTLNDQLAETNPELL